ncbi:MAG: EF-hand domain-containing protein [Thermomonas hydrothermalis]|uniref:EF-hand domain-containing protein n=1 Tax=Thermomonas hydrothermalis TaxID=213588 RepID=UPI002356B9F2|nr:EF-hand domain-containing protein [Thermomonas hydrothermalis]MCL6619580.1 EF-hand domain-containing protein [Thermomonas hydrothermalis]
MKYGYAMVLTLALLAPVTSPAQQAKPAMPAPGQDEVEQTFKAWDRNGDGQLSREEFRTGWQQLQEALRLQQALRRQFASLDSNHDGAIDASEYGNLLLIKRAGKAAPPLARFDSNGDGKLQFAEYVKLVQTLAPQQSAPAAAPAAKGATR